jgi:hypothetical protein
VSTTAKLFPFCCRYSIAWHPYFPPPTIMSIFPFSDAGGLMEV